MTDRILVEQNSRSAMSDLEKIKAVMMQSTETSFETVGEEVFGATEYNWQHVKATQSDEEKFQYCSNCTIPMNKTTSGLECPTCHATKDVIGDIRDCSEDSTGILKTSYGGSYGGKKTTVMSNQDNSKSQKKQIIDQLNRLNEQYLGPKFPKAILESTAVRYNDIQKLVVEKYDENGDVCGTKKFVKRSSIKDEILGALLYYECIDKQCSRKKKDVADFMQLQSNGISRGDTILRDLHNSDKIVIPIHIEPTNDFTRRYLIALDLYKFDEYGDATEISLRYYEFVEKIVARSNDLRISWNSIGSSKIVGAIWVLINKLKLDIPHTTVTTCCDGIRKNTFTRFSKEIESKITVFNDIFTKCEIPMVS